MILFCTGAITPVTTTVDTSAVIRYKVGNSGPLALTFNLNYAVGKFYSQTRELRKDMFPLITTCKICSYDNKGYELF